MSGIRPGYPDPGRENKNQEFVDLDARNADFGEGEESPKLRRLGRTGDDEAGLGSLAQAARLKQLNTARWLLIVVGILTIGVNAFLLFNIRAEVRKGIDDEIRKMGNVVVDPNERRQVEDQAIAIASPMCGVAIALGILFVVFGLLVKSFPVPITITSLVVYIVVIVGFAILEPESLRRGFILRIIVIVALAKAIQAAIAYQRERNLEAYSAELT